MPQYTSSGIRKRFSNSEFSNCTVGALAGCRAGSQPAVIVRCFRSSLMADRTDSIALTVNNVLPTKVDASSLRFESNMRALADMVAQIRNEEEIIREGGGPKAIENQHSKGRLTARERINLLADPGTFFELGVY